MNKQTQFMIDYAEANYIPFTVYHLDKEDKIVLGNENNRICRFCSKGETETTFSTVAHAIPEFVGNKKLIANYECDNCNQKFSRLLESHMGNYMNLWHTLSQVRGKRSVPSFKTINDKSRIDIKDKINIEEHDGDSIVSINEKEQTITITAKRRSYVPIAVYKTLTKMALTIMPEGELADYKATLEWINEEQHQESPQDLKNLVVLMSIADGVKPFPFVSCMLFKRKENHRDNVPNMMFMLAYGNFVFQIYIPMCAQDAQLAGTQINYTFLPTFLDLDGERLKRKQINMSSKVKVVEEQETVTLHFESMEEVPIPPPNELTDTDNPR